MGRGDLTFERFKATVRAVKGSCDSTVFSELSTLAVALYRQSPDLGEEIARLMTNVWGRRVRNGYTWDDRAEELGQLFADLDLPPHQVAGGEPGARHKWQKLERIANSLPGANSQAA